MKVSIETSSTGHENRETYVLGKDFDDWDFSVNEFAGMLDPAYPSLLKAAKLSTTTELRTAPNEPQSAVAVFSHEAHAKRSTEDCEESWREPVEAYRQLCLLHGTSNPCGWHRAVRADHDIQVHFQGGRRGRTCEMPSLTVEGL